ncbi:MAG: methionine synthase [Clostridia bacterium]|nr:methionine synthase [Clostridia bacterium]MCL6521114.1 methionine synthase [Bacillota bacterium]
MTGEVREPGRAGAAGVRKTGIPHRTLRTTGVGSLPKPPALLEARERVRRGELEPAELRRLEREATEAWIRFQEEIGIDVPVHGEMERGDMATYFAELLEGFAISGPVRSYGNRYYRKPIVTGPVRRTRPLVLESWREAQALTDRPVKAILTGPYTLCDWSFNEYYPDRRSLTLALAEALHEEVLDLQAAGAQFIQIDEPAISTRPEEIGLAIEAMGRVTEGLKAHTVSHICYGHWEEVLPALLELPVDQLDLEMANGGYALLDLLRRYPFEKEIGLGVIDVHSHRVESVEEVKRGIYRALEFLPPDRVYVDPDCGLKTRTEEEARRKLEVMVEAVREVRQELGLA